MSRDVSACGDGSSISITGEEEVYTVVASSEAWWSYAAMRLRYHTIEPHLLRVPSHFYALPRLSSTAAKLGPENRFHLLRGSLVLPGGFPSLDVGNSSCNCNEEI